MNITFCGHSQVENSRDVTDWLLIITQKLIEQGGKTFYLGGYGEFDSLAASVLREKKKLYPQIELILVLPYLHTSKEILEYDDTIYPPLESVPPRYAISKRNQWMVDISDVVVAYYQYLAIPRHHQDSGQGNRKLLSKMCRHQAGMSYCFPHDGVLLLQ